MAPQHKGSKKWEARMRSTKELREIVDATIAVSKGTCPFIILAEDNNEQETLLEMLKGRHGAKEIRVRRKDDE